MAPSQAVPGKKTGTQPLLLGKSLEAADGHLACCSLEEGHGLLRLVGVSQTLPLHLVPQCAVLSPSVVLSAAFLFVLGDILPRFPQDLGSQC